MFSFFEVVQIFEIVEFKICRGVKKIHVVDIICEVNKYSLLTVRGKVPYIGSEGKNKQKRRCCLISGLEVKNRLGLEMLLYLAGARAHPSPNAGIMGHNRVNQTFVY